MGVLLTAANPSAGFAQAVTLKPLIDLHLRYERVEQDGGPDPATALTIRARTGLSATKGPITGLIEVQGNLALVDHYDDTVSGPSRYAIVGDPENVAVYRLQIQYARPGLTATGGRQRISLNDERFVGVANWRQNARSYDAVRVEWAAVNRVRADLTYSWSIRTPAGINGTGAKPTAIGGDNVFANLSYQVPAGTITAFAYLIDQDEAAVQDFRLSSQNYGIRATLKNKINSDIKVNWSLSYARQSNYHRNPNRFSAVYYLADTGLELGPARLGVGYEVLGADEGRALTSFQTPLASIFKFQGWADKFTTTPPDGVRDLYGSAGWTWKRMGPLSTILVQGVYHRFSSDRAARLYGDEVDLLASAKWSRYVLSARYATYHADRFATDTRKFWIEMTYSL